jgi:hypothetical protein
MGAIVMALERLLEGLAPQATCLPQDDAGVLAAQAASLRLVAKTPLQRATLAMVKQHAALAMVGQQTPAATAPAANAQDNVDSSAASRPWRVPPPMPVGRAAFLERALLATVLLAMVPMARAPIVPQGASLGLAQAGQWD